MQEAYLKNGRAGEGYRGGGQQLYPEEPSHNLRWTVAVVMVVVSQKFGCAGCREEMSMERSD